MKIGVLGAGAIGCFVGGRLLAAGHDVVMVGRLGEEIAKHGLLLTDFQGGRTVLEPARVRYAAGPDALAGVEATIVTVKSMATSDAVTPLASIACGTIVSFQNGVSNAKRIREALPRREVLAGMVPFNVARPEPGHFHNGTSGALVIESRGGLETALVAALRSAGFPVEPRADIDAVLWTKLLINLNNAVNALAGVPLREQLGNRAYRRLMADCVREGLAAMHGAGLAPVRLGRMIPRIAPLVLSLPDWLFFRVAAAMVKIDPHARSSMLDDLERGRVTEIDYLNGEVVALGERTRVPTPVNRAIVSLVKAAETANAGSPKLSPEAIRASGSPVYGGGGKQGKGRTRWGSGDGAHCC